MVSNGNAMLISLTIVILLKFASFCEGRQMEGSKGVIKSIKTDDGDVINCIDILKQPAFTHPLLANHTIQMKPSYGTIDGKFELEQPWHKYGRCPEGSIPITGNQINRPVVRKQPFNQLASDLHKYAVVTYGTPILPVAGTIYGAHATLNLWRPKVNYQDFSLSQMWISTGDTENEPGNTIEVGWQVFPKRGGNDPRIFTYWTSDNYQRTGCYNLECPGFVQTSKDLHLGSALINPSVYNGQQQVIHVTIKKDDASRNWWLTISGHAIGYWPSSLFTTLANAADNIIWGGEVYHIPTMATKIHSKNFTSDATNNNPPEMGNGHFASEGYKKSCYVRNMIYYDKSGSEIRPPINQLSPFVTQTSCYDIKMETMKVDNIDQVFLFFGGPGCVDSNNYV